MSQPIIDRIVNIWRPLQLFNILLGNIVNNDIFLHKKFPINLIFNIFQMMYNWVYKRVEDNTWIFMYQFKRVWFIVTWSLGNQLYNWLTSTRNKQPW